MSYISLKLAVTTSVTESSSALSSHPTRQMRDIAIKTENLARNTPSVIRSPTQSDKHPVPSPEYPEPSTQRQVKKLTFLPASRFIRGSITSFYRPLHSRRKERQVLLMPTLHGQMLRTKSVSFPDRISPLSGKNQKPLASLAPSRFTQLNPFLLLFNRGSITPEGANGPHYITVTEPPIGEQTSGKR